MPSKSHIAFDEFKKTIHFSQRTCTSSSCIINDSLILELYRLMFISIRNDNNFINIHKFFVQNLYKLEISTILCKIINEKYIYNIFAFIKTLNEYMLDTKKLYEKQLHQKFDGDTTSIIAQYTQYDSKKDPQKFIRKLKKCFIMFEYIKNNIITFSRFGDYNLNNNRYEQIKFETKIIKETHLLSSKSRAESESYNYDLIEAFEKVKNMTVAKLEKKLQKEHTDNIKAQVDSMKAYENRHSLNEFDDAD
jgi:hypothetical protein